MTEEEFRNGTAATTSFDYMAECDKTCSTVFKPEQVEVADMKYILMGVVGFAEDLNLIKKLLFRGKTRDDLNMGGFEGESVGVLIDNLMSNEAWSPADIDVLHGAVGVITEAGEVAEYLVRFLEGKGFDRVNVLEESGDLGWYIVRSLRGIGVDRDLCDMANIDKLRGRHGEAFDVFRDANRKLGDERSKLENAYHTDGTTPLFGEPIEVMKNPPPFGDDVDPSSRDVLNDIHAKGIAHIQATHEDRETSPEVASLAGRVLGDPDSTEAERSLAGSALSQAGERKPKGDMADMAERIAETDVKAVPKGGVRG